MANGPDEQGHRGAQTGVPVHSSLDLAVLTFDEPQGGFSYTCLCYPRLTYSQISVREGNTFNQPLLSTWGVERFWGGALNGRRIRRTPQHIVSPPLSSRPCQKLHIAIDAVTGEIVACDLTSKSATDASRAPWCYSYLAVCADGRKTGGRNCSVPESYSAFLEPFSESC